MGFHTFFLVWRNDGAVPTRKHPTFAEAKSEAERLSLKHNERFHVLRCIASCVPRKVVWESEAHDALERRNDAVPFPMPDTHADF